MPGKRKQVKQVEKQIARDLEKEFKQQGVKCPRCNRTLKCSTLEIDNVNIRPVTIGCKKCRYYYLDSFTTNLAIKDVKIVYAGNKKIKNQIISRLKRGMKEGISY